MSAPLLDEAITATVGATGGYRVTTTRPESASMFRNRERRAMTMQQSAPNFFDPYHLMCPDCEASMRLSAVTPLQSPRSAEEVTYRCEACGIEQKKIIKPL
jgi:hypothetical protein